MAGRFTLAQSVVLTIPNYFIKSMKIPKGVCDEIERLARQFIWGSNTKGRKLALVDWGDNMSTSCLWWTQFKASISLPIKRSYGHA
ncbi:hypothetical protein J1N35_022080 [Gossypium stocksii]|uniref:Reverse transcriptase zinc-binding domain-containing protein n=1 Tax=Gossypium stocksii TaxID=47602 RepID=A0A9D3VH20_9ROSI|nr:hypothetical protein J1N35_022080 [Gossypium stocksii]